MAALLIVSLILGSEQGEPPSLLEQRAATRVRLVTGGGATVALGRAVSMIAPSLHFEAGAMLNDRFAVGGMLDLGTQLGLSTLLLGANAMWVVTEWLALGAGLALGHLGATGWEEFTGGQALLVPLRADVAIPVRGSRLVKRHGLALTLMAAPGVILVSHRGFGPVREGAVTFQFVGAVGLAYALW